MLSLPRPVSKLIESFERLPGIGPKSAQRLTFYLLHVPQTYLEGFAEALINLKKNTVECNVCFNVSETDPCVICASPSRDKSIICVVEQPIDILSLERTDKHHGVYHVLHGAINPLQNIGPEEIRIAELIKRVKFYKSGSAADLEIILATNPNMEGEATAMYITKQLRGLTTHNTSTSLSASPQLATLKITRLAHGLPVGGDLEYADELTLSRALEGRREF
ncbi:MAG: recombination mediator RecR [Patescibacteria group bacterium]